MITSTHRELAHRAIDYDIDNITDELHDRALDDYIDMIAPHLDALRALAYARHDIACDLACDIAHTADIDPAFDMIDAPCLSESAAAISALAYSFYRD
jgi:hypothetical protein